MVGDYSKRGGRLYPNYGLSYAGHTDLFFISSTTCYDSTTTTNSSPLLLLDENV